jgi:adenine-specific DNA-methyltransferase
VPDDSPTIADEVAHLRAELAKARLELQKVPRFGLVWEERDEQAEVDMRGRLPVLVAEPDLNVAGAQPASKPHILIEGDNLHALTILQATHRGKVDVIYIDPPYNTGKEFVYNDKLVGAEDQWRHSAWLSFMDKRLRLARELLTETGVIFISIDDNEQAHLRLLCDQVFGETNLLGQICWDKGNSQADAASVQKNHEYVVAFTKDSCQLVKTGAGLRCSSSKRRKVLEDAHGKYYLGSIVTGGEGGTLNARPNLGWVLYYNPEDGDVVINDVYDRDTARTLNDVDRVYDLARQSPGEHYVPILPPAKGDRLGCWTWSAKKARADLHNLAVVRDSNGAWTAKKKVRVQSSDEAASAELPLRSVLKLASSLGTRETTAQVGAHAFSHPKPTSLVRSLLESVPSKHCVVLDFFAGSGTTAHAVAQLNAEDGGTRQAILVTNNSGKQGRTYVEDAGDEGICRSVTQPRMRAVLTGAWADGKVHDPLPGALVYYRVELLGRRANRDAERVAIARRATEIVACAENTHTPVATGDTWTLLSGDQHAAAVIPTDLYFHEYPQVREMLEAALPADTKTTTVYLYSGTDQPIATDIAEQFPGWAVKPLPGPILAAMNRGIRAATARAHDTGAR